jgi:ribosome biogenesis protein ENP2
LQVVDFVILSEDWTKMVFLQDDRTLSFHAAYGAHYGTRIPKFGRTLAYHAPSCDLYVGGSSNEIYRLNLAEGSFRAPLASQCPAINKLEFNPVHQLLGAGGQDGVLELWDPRSRERLAGMDMGVVLASRCAVVVVVVWIPDGGGESDVLVWAGRRSR